MLNNEEKAHLIRDLRSLLIPHFWFRIQIQFHNPKGRSIKRTFYGDEHQCTYNQCLHGYTQEIIMFKEKGYKELIKMAEQKYKGQYSYATIYGRESLEEKKYDRVCRQYANGVENIDLRNDPVLSPDEFRTIYFQVIQVNGRPHRLQLLDENPLQHDFKTMVTESLK